MSNASELPVFELTVPRRPTLEDVGGATLEDDSEAGAPDKTRMPYAAQLNQLQTLAAAMGRVMPVALIWYRYQGAAPAATIHQVSCASSQLTTATFTPTRDGAGNVRIEWAANTFPSPLGEPVASLNYTTDADNPSLIAMAGAQAALITNGVRVRTYSAAGVATDYNFLVALY